MLNKILKKSAVLIVLLVLLAILALNSFAVVPVGSTGIMLTL